MCLTNVKRVNQLLSICKLTTVEELFYSTTEKNAFATELCKIYSTKLTVDY